MSTPRTIIRTVLAWPVDSQRGSRRNALVASTALNRAASERREVEEFLLAHTVRRP